MSGNRTETLTDKAVIADQNRPGRVVTRHSHAVEIVAQIMQPEFVQLRVVADRAPARDDVGGRVPPGILREQEGVRIAGAGQRRDNRLRGLAEPHGARASLGIGQRDRTVADFAPSQIEHFAPAA